MTRPSLRARLSVFLRSFLIQGTWNNRTMLGGGFAFSLLPVLREMAKRTGRDLPESIRRHSEHFNAHPYMANLALGAVSKLEAEGEDPESIRRFKVALRGPLGSLGDALIWVGWRPATVLAGLTLALAGISPGWVLGFFLVVYNLGHLAVRIWGFRTGLARGSDVGRSLGSLAIPRQADRINGIGVFLVGCVAGLVLARGISGDVNSVFWIAPVAVGLWAGGRVGQRALVPLLWGASALVMTLFLAGWL